ncbi:hypothetical protein ACTMU2_16365 [Cupriavidus basilensis]
MSAINMPYRIPNVRVETAEVSAHARIGWFRSVANIPHAFAAQCFIAELAHRAGKDHKQFALELIGPARASSTRPRWPIPGTTVNHRSDTPSTRDDCAV